MPETQAQETPIVIEPTEEVVQKKRWYRNPFILGALAIPAGILAYKLLSSNDDEDESTEEENDWEPAPAPTSTN